MTALQEFTRLECAGIWKKNPSAQRQDVIVSFGDSTLVLSDIAGRVLAHWSLPAVERISYSNEVALYSADPEHSEMLEISDNLMIDALSRIERAVSQQAPHPGRLRFAIGAFALIALGTFSAWALPPALSAQAQRAIGLSAARQLDVQIEQEIEKLAGQSCETPEGRQALNALSRRIGGQQTITMIRGDLAGPVALPGGTVLLDRAMVELADDPAIPAGFAKAASLRQGQALKTSLSYISTFGRIALLSQGTLRDGDAHKIALKLIEERQKPSFSPEFVQDAFSAAQLPLRPWAVYVSKREALASPFSDLPESELSEAKNLPPILTDSQWVALQAICETG